MFNEAKPPPLFPSPQKKKKKRKMEQKQYRQKNEKRKNGQKIIGKGRSVLYNTEFYIVFFFFCLFFEDKENKEINKGGRSSVWNMSKELRGCMIATTERTMNHLPIRVGVILG